MKVAYVGTKDKRTTAPEEFDHYVAVDWAKTVMAIAHMGRSATSLRVFERPASVKELKEYLGSLTGRIVLTVEETTTAHWLYLELRDLVTRLVICDPYHNRLLCHGAKTDKIDAGKLCQLLRSGLLKEVFHTGDSLYELRTLISAYEDMIRAGVRCRNQQEALQRGHRDQTKGSVGFQLTQDYLGQSLALYEQTKAQYQKRFAQLCRRLRPLRILTSLPGIGPVGAVTIAAYVVDAHRFLRRGHYLSYCGLVTHEKRSGGKTYGRRRGRYNHALKAVYKMAALAVLRSRNSPFRPYIEHLRAAGCAEYNVRHALARLLATISLGMLKHGQRFDVHHLTWYQEEAPANS